MYVTVAQNDHDDDDDDYDYDGGGGMMVVGPNELPTWKRPSTTDQAF